MKRALLVIDVQKTASQCQLNRRRKYQRNPKAATAPRPQPTH